MVMNLILVWMVCQCNVYVIPESISRKDLGYKYIKPSTVKSSLNENSKENCGLNFLPRLSKDSSARHTAIKQSSISKTFSRVKALFQQ